MPVSVHRRAVRGGFLAFFALAASSCGGFVPEVRLQRRAALLVLGLAAPAEAAIPMMEEFYQGSGSQVSRPREEIEAEQAAVQSAWDQEKSLSLDQAAQVALNSLKGAEGLLKSGDFDGVRSILVSPSVGSIGIVQSPSRAGGKAVGAWADKCSKSKSCESSLMIARGSLQQLEEWCFSKRAFYFNSADKKQVESRQQTASALKKLQEDLEEPMEFLDQGRSALEEVLSFAR